MTVRGERREGIHDIEGDKESPVRPGLAGQGVADGGV